MGYETFTKNLCKHFVWPLIIVAGKIRHFAFLVYSISQTRHIQRSCMFVILYSLIVGVSLSDSIVFSASVVNFISSLYYWNIHFRNYLQQIMLLPPPEQKLQKLQFHYCGCTVMYMYCDVTFRWSCLCPEDLCTTLISDTCINLDHPEI